VLLTSAPAVFGPGVVVAGILPAVAGGILPPGWKPVSTAGWEACRYEGGRPIFRRARMAKAEISWKGRTAEGERREVYARHVGNRWLFFERERRFEQWRALPQPPLADWLELLDAVERRVSRRRLRPEEPDRVRAAIRERFPGAQLAPARSRAQSD